MPIETWTAEQITEEFKKGRRSMVLKFVYGERFRDLNRKKISEMTGRYQVSVTDYEVVVYDKPDPVRETLKHERTQNIC